MTINCASPCSHIAATHLSARAQEDEKWCFTGRRLRERKEFLHWSSSRITTICQSGEEKTVIIGGNSQGCRGLQVLLYCVEFKVLPSYFAIHSQEAAGGVCAPLMYLIWATYSKQSGWKGEKNNYVSYFRSSFEGGLATDEQRSKSSSVRQCYGKKKQPPRPPNTASAMIRTCGPCLFDLCGPQTFE